MGCMISIQKTNSEAGQVPIWFGHHLGGAVRVNNMVCQVQGKSELAPWLSEATCQEDQGQADDQTGSKGWSWLHPAFTLPASMNKSVQTFSSPGAFPAPQAGCSPL